MLFVSPPNLICFRMCTSCCVRTLNGCTRDLPPLCDRPCVSHVSDVFDPRTGTSCEGIYRVSGSTTRVRELVQKVASTCACVHVCLYLCVLGERMSVCIGLHFPPRIGRSWQSSMSALARKRRTCSHPPTLPHFTQAIQIESEQGVAYTRTRSNNTHTHAVTLAYARPTHTRRTGLRGPCRRSHP